MVVKYLPKTAQCYSRQAPQWTSTKPESLLKATFRSERAKTEEEEENCSIYKHNGKNRRIVTTNLKKTFVKNAEVDRNLDRENLAHLYFLFVSCFPFSI